MFTWTWIIAVIYFGATGVASANWSCCWRGHSWQFCGSFTVNPQCQRISYWTCFHMCTQTLHQSQLHVSCALCTLENYEYTIHGICCMFFWVTCTCRISMSYITHVILTLCFCSAFHMIAAFQCFILGDEVVIMTWKFQIIRNFAMSWIYWYLQCMWHKYI
jgi:hypothetical protein